MKIISGVYWDKGRRSCNQDSLMLEQVVTGKGRVVLAAVSDGIGGLAEGETASGFLLEKLLQNFYHQLLPFIGRGRGKKALTRSILRCFFEANTALKQYAVSKGIALGTTISMLLIWKKNYMAVHLGDSRIYRIKSGERLRQLTKDHSDGRNALTKCMGSFPYQSPDIVTGKIKGKTGFLLCSDGFIHYQKNDMLRELLCPEEVVKEEQLEKRLGELAGYEMKQGERDNISAVYLICG